MKNILFALALLAGASIAQAATIQVMIGDNDGFGGLHGASSAPGQAFNPANLLAMPLIGPGPTPI